MVGSSWHLGGLIDIPYCMACVWSNGTIVLYARNERPISRHLSQGQGRLGYTPVPDPYVPLGWTSIVLGLGCYIQIIL
jgi:hypothetical protein